MGQLLKKDKRPPVKIQLRKNDQVKVIAGKDKGKSGRVLGVDSATGRILVEKVNIIKKHVRKNPAKHIAGGLAEQEASIAVSNVMILCSNLWVLAFRPSRLRTYYVLLACSLIVASLVPMSTFLNLPGAARVVVSCAVVFVPVFFAGVIFGTAFRDATAPDIALGSNIGGAILGGLSENLSLLIGFNNLCVLALLFYAMSALSLRKQT